MRFWCTAPNCIAIAGISWWRWWDEKAVTKGVQMTHPRASGRLLDQSRETQMLPCVEPKINVSEAGPEPAVRRRFSSRVPKWSVMYAIRPNFKMIVHASILKVPTDLEEGSGVWGRERTAAGGSTFENKMKIWLWMLLVWLGMRRRIWKIWKNKMKDLVSV
jgi:hypothetical protein